MCSIPTCETTWWRSICSSPIDVELIIIPHISIQRLIHISISCPYISSSVSCWTDSISLSYGKIIRRRRKIGRWTSLTCCICWGSTSLRITSLTCSWFSSCTKSICSWVTVISYTTHSTCLCTTSTSCTTWSPRARSPYICTSCRNLAPIVMSTISSICNCIVRISSSNQPLWKWICSISINRVSSCSLWTTSSITRTNIICITWIPSSSPPSNLKYSSNWTTSTTDITWIIT